MRAIFFISVLLSILSCKDEQQKTTVQEIAGTKDTGTVVVKPQAEQQIVKEEDMPVIDTGQTWFRVRITRNDSAYMDYEGSWPVFLLAGNSATLQLIKSKKLMSISDGLAIYMNGMPSGKVPVVPSNREKGTVSMIFMPVNDGAYGLAITLTEGYLNITKNVNSVVNGNFEGKGADLNKDIFVFKGYFINTKINPDKI